MLHHPITYYWVHILKIQPLDYMFYMFLTYMRIFMLIRCNLPFDLWTHFLYIILMGRNFYSLLRERERERESTKGWNSWILDYNFEVETWKFHHFFYRYNYLENKNRPFLYRMYIKGFFLDCKQKGSSKEYKVLYVNAFLFIFLWILE